jgi:hypothetical protein
MKLKLLLLILVLTGGILSAQDTIRTLIITEARLDRQDQAYVELTNIGTTPVQLADFKFGKMSAYNVPWTPALGDAIRLPERILQPGESFIIAAFFDFIEKAHFADPDNFGRNLTKKELWTLADLQIHMDDANSQLHPEIKDSISANAGVLTVWNGRDCWYLEQHLSESDSVVVDQVGGVFDEENGTNYDRAYDVAGVTNATYTTILMRKFIVKRGNINFADARGVGLDDSEWMPVPLSYANYDLDRAVFWTAGNHGDYNLDENTLVSDELDVDWANKTITVPWGTRNQDDIMTYFEKKPGIAWHYHLSEAREDSAYNSARTGDKLTIYVCGKDLDVETFDIIVAEPTKDANLVIPMYRTGADGFYSEYINTGADEVFWVTENAPGMDTITNDFYGIPFATQVDTLTKYLEKAPKASWEFIWVDGVWRAAVQNGDKLKVTAENGDVKEYFIKVNGYRPNRNAYLSAITWPDIPEYYKGIYGWIGDTIPNFGNTSYNYKVQVPLDVNGIPALVAKTEQLNTKVEVKRASNLDGTNEQKTVTFTVTAEDGVTTNVYKVQLEKEKDSKDVQPFVAEPFLSEVVFRDNFANNFWEICNPGNQPLDLSNYMFYWGGSSDPSAAIRGSSSVTDWANRYNKYIPGYKWLNEVSWAVNPGILEQDLNVNPIVMPGDVFVMADIVSVSLSGYPWWASEQSDVIFRTAYNPWRETCNKGAIWYNNNFFMFKILNDSVKSGLKPANDPNDFEVMETWSMGDGTRWLIGGELANQVFNYMRKPQYYKATPAAKESWGTNTEDSQWIRQNEAYWNALNAGWPNRRLWVTLDVGKHFMNEVTTYKSTVTSIVYKVSKGFSMKESILGVKTGTTVSDFLGGIVKVDENQTLKVKSTANGSELAPDAMLSLNDTLVVLSADSTNTTKYMLNVSEEGLSSNAVLTSGRYDITIVSQPKSAGNENAGTGTIKGFDYGTALRTILANITVPAGASLDMVDGNGAYVPLKMLNFDTAYVNVTVNDNIYFDVIAENGVTEIIYQLVPAVSDNDAFITSDVYSVVQKDLLIDYVPRGTSVDAFLANIVPSAGAAMKLVDKLGHERTSGTIVADDKIVVTSPNGFNTRVYFISHLPTQYIQETTYLAYIQSAFYSVDQVAYKVNGVSGTETVSDFMTRVKASQGATAVVVDENGNQKLNGDINGGDMVLVTSADGKMKVYYTFGPLTSSNVYESNGIDLYPNPTNGKINVSGVKAGDRIQVYNSVGAVIRDINVQSSIESVSLDNQPAGMYMIVISDQNKTLGRYKALRK